MPKERELNPKEEFAAVRAFTVGSRRARQKRHALLRDKYGKRLREAAQLLVAAYEATGEKSLMEAFTILESYGLAGIHKGINAEALRRKFVNVTGDPAMVRQLIDGQNMDRKTIASMHLVESTGHNVAAGRKRVDAAYHSDKSLPDGNTGRFLRVCKFRCVAPSKRETPKALNDATKPMSGDPARYRSGALIEISQVRTVPDNRYWRDQVASGRWSLFPTVQVFASVD